MVALRNNAAHMRHVHILVRQTQEMSETYANAFYVALALHSLG